ncbi:MAG: alkaline phosphatase [Bacteroidota bacterium]|nr:alkaline phosphatase [Bacteroidota bacterium]
MKKVKHIIALTINIAFAFFISVNVNAQENYKGVSKADSLRTYPGGPSYNVKTYPSQFKRTHPKNVILMIGDGMGTAQIYAGLTANHGDLFLSNFHYSGFSRTQSSDHYVTDSAAGGTALSTGHKTLNGALAVDPQQKTIETILEMAVKKNKATGLVSTSSITHATPASFIAHQASRGSYEDIALDFMKTNFTVFIGGGYKHFHDRKDGKDLIPELEKKGYKVLRSMEEIQKVKSGKLAGLTADEHNPRYPERGDMLPQSTHKAIDLLSMNPKGFFLMVEGSQIDWGGHQNDTRYIVDEMLDFDRAIGQALDFASKNKETLIIVTADHETGGFSLLDGNMKTGMVKGAFTTGDHSGVMVPIFAYGPGAEEFSGMMENTEVAKKIIDLLQLKK